MDHFQALRKAAPIAFLVTIFLMFTSTSQAQDFDPEADWKVSVYLWAMGLEGDLGIGDISTDVDLDFSDLLSSLDYGGSLLLRRDWGANLLVADLSYFSLTPPDQSGPMGGVVESRLKMPLIQAYYGRKWGTAEQYGALLVGARHMTLDLSLNAMPGVPTDPELRASASPSFTDVIIGGLVTAPLGQKWSMTFEGDVGGGGSNNSWNAQLLFQRSFDSGNLLTLGARILSVDFDDTLPNGEAFLMDAEFAGAVIGYTWD